MPRFLHQISYVLHVRHVIICKISCGGAFSPCPPSAPHSVYVANQTSGKVEVDNTVNSLKVYSSSHQVGANEYPNVSSSKLLNNLITFALLFVTMDNIYIDSVIDKFVVQLFRSLFGLHKYKHRRLETFFKTLPERDQLGILSAYIDNILLNSSRSCILDSNLYFYWVCHYFAHQFLNSWLHSGAEHKFSHLSVVWEIAQDLVYLFKKAHLKHFVCLVNHYHLQAVNCWKLFADASKL